MFIKYTFDYSEPTDFSSIDTYMVYDTDFEATVRVETQNTNLRNYSALYYEIYYLYKNRNIALAPNIQRLFLDDYKYSLDNRGIDILETAFFIIHRNLIDKVLILL